MEVWQNLREEHLEYLFQEVKDAYKKYRFIARDVTNSADGITHHN